MPYIQARNGDGYCKGVRTLGNGTKSFHGATVETLTLQ